MAAVDWTEQRLKNNIVKLTGKTRLACRHVVSENARVRDNPAAIAQGKRTVGQLLVDATTRHLKECDRT